MSRTLSSLGCIGLLFAGFITSTAFGAVQNPENQLADLIRQLSNHEISRVEIAAVPFDFETRSALTPELVNSAFDRKLILANFLGRPFEQSLIAVLQQTRIKNPGTIPDLRISIEFYKQGEQSSTAEISLDRSGVLGTLDGMPMTFNTALWNWLRTNYSHCFNW